MAKKSRKIADPELEEIVVDVIDALEWERSDDLIQIAVPSHEQDETPLGRERQQEWAKKTMRLLADHFQGATAQRSNKGVYKLGSRYLWDDTILVQSFAPCDTLKDVSVVREVIKFAQEMRRELNQDSVMVVFNNVMRFVKGGK
jgi:hypothetical protein